MYTNYINRESIVKWLKSSIAACVLAAIGASGAAYAGGHVTVGIGVGVPAYSYYPYPYYVPVAPAPAYYYAPEVAVPDDPPTYVERGQAVEAGPQQQAGTWYYCDAARAYYPYVKQCASGWRAVPANPPAPDQ